MSFLNWVLRLFGYELSKIKKAHALPRRASIDLSGALLLIKEFEGFRSEAYLCPANIPTIGYGRTKGVTLGMRVTREEAERDLLEDILSERLPVIQKLCTTPLSVNETNALVSFVYNIGAGAFEKSTLLRLLNSGAPRAVVAEQFDRWTRVKGKILRGLVRRREQEKRLFLTPDTQVFQL